MKFQSVVVITLLFCCALELRSQTTAFTYQGQLNSNSVPANGLYDLRFQLFNVSSNAVGSAFTNSPTGVTNGLFAVTLDFGSSVFDGSDRWLQIAVRNYGDTNSYTPLSPLQPITSVPYAIRSVNALTLTAPLQSTNITGIVPVANLPTNVAFLNSNQTFTGANVFSGAVTANNSANTFFGNGAGLKNLTATNVVGTLPDANLSANVALQSNTVINFAGSVGATNFIGAGHGLTNVPGAFFWVVPSTSGQMYPNVGYICTNDVAPVTMTLPASPSIGDTFKICGVGAGGWIVGQANGQTIFSGNLSSSVGQSWKTNGPTASWSSIASSADGTKLAATINNGTIYVSTNSGVTWTSRDSSRYWSSVAVSADGKRMAATVGYTIYNTSATGNIYISTDSGSTWTSRDSSRNWSAVASSADGMKLVALNYTGSGTSAGVYTSVNGGTSWKQQVSGSFCSTVASSSDGTKLVLTIDSVGIYTSADSGTNWLSRTNLSLNWRGIASSSDGTRLVAVATSGAVYVSRDSGVTWFSENPFGILGSSEPTAVASSSDGSRLAAVVGGSSFSDTGNVFLSQDSGDSWATAGNAPTLQWSGIASSADGSLLAATVYGGPIYISSQSSTTPGASGYVSGAQHSALELIYTGNGVFLPLNHEGTIRAF